MTPPGRTARGRPRHLLLHPCWGTGERKLRRQSANWRTSQRGRRRATGTGARREGEIARRDISIFKEYVTHVDQGWNSSVRVDECQLPTDVTSDGRRLELGMTVCVFALRGLVDLRSIHRVIALVWMAHFMRVMVAHQMLVR